MVILVPVGGVVTLVREQRLDRFQADKSSGRVRGRYRGDDEEFAAHEVEEAHRARAVGEGQQRTVMAPRHPPPLGVWVLWN